MLDDKKIASYYSQTRPFYHRFLKEIFSQQDMEKMKEYTKNKTTIRSDQLNLDEMFLFEARNFLRLSIFNLLAYKLLVCKKYLAWGKVTLYYSYFYSVMCLLRLAGRAVVHVTKYEDLLSTKTSNRLYSDVFTFQLVRNRDTHSYAMMPMRENEHRFAWNTFSTLYPELSTHIGGQLAIEERIRWNYELLYPSQATEEYIIRQAKDYCENDFLDPDFGNATDPEAAEYLHELMADIGYEEAYAGQLIEEAIRLFVIIALSSKHKEDYVSFMKSVIDEVDSFESKEETNEEIKKWLRDGITRLSAE